MAKVELDIIGRIEKVQKDIKNVKSEMGKLQKKSDDVNKKVRGHFEKTGETAQKLKSYIAGVFTIAAIAGFLKQMIAVRSEFEKYRAVLKNTLGSQQAANKEFEMLKQFAATTPFALRELTDSYVKLINYGIKPTREELRKLGDLAAAMGKGFIQITEAIADAITGEFERLKEFGIRASKEGDKVTFSFKGVKTQVDFTDKAIKNYIVSLGDLQGVSGGMAEISKTLGGKISNLGDAWDSLMDTMGGRTQGIIKGTVDGLSDLTGTVEDLVILSEQADESWLENIGKLLKTTNILYPLLLAGGEAYDFLSEEIHKATGATAEAIIGYAKMDDEMEKGITVAIEQEKTIKDLKDEIKSWQKQLETASRDEIPEINQKIAELTKNLKDLLKLGLEQAPEMKIIKDVLKKVKEIIVPTDMLEETGIKTEYEELQDWFAQEQEKKLDEEIEKIRQAEYEKDTLRQAAADAAINIYSSISQAAMQNMNAELEAAEGNEKKQEEIRKKYARRNQIFAVGKAFISGSLAIMKIAENWAGTPMQIALTALQVIQTAAQIAAIKAQKFATGVLDLKGKGSAKSDSIPAMLSRGESVMTADETKDYFPYLKAMKEGKFPTLQLELLKDAMKLSNITNNSLDYDNRKEIDRLDKIYKALNKEQYSETIEGNYKIIKRGSITTKISLN